MKKIVLLSISCLLTLMLTSTTLAEPSQDNSDQMASVIAAIKELGAKIEALSIAYKKSSSDIRYQVDKNLDLASQVNIQKNDSLQQAQNNATYNTQNQISNALLQFPEQVVNTNLLNDSDLINKIKERKNLIPNLTTHTLGSDTLYLDEVSDPLARSYGVGKPNAKDIQDNYFNFDSLFAPLAYNDNQKKIARTYLDYLVQQYKSLTEGINLEELKTNLNGMSSQKRAESLKTLLNDPSYQKFQLQVRSLLATKSIALSNLNMLFSERTPIKELGNKAHMPNNDNLPPGYASPLEVENYIANQRINSPTWYQQMKTASPAAIAREQTIILAEIESQLQRNHLDNERLLATLSLMALQGTQNAETALKASAQDLNNLIKQLGKSDSN